MDSRALLVRSSLRWALDLVQRHEASSVSTPGPRLAQIRLGDLMSRTDAETMHHLALELLHPGSGDTIDSLKAAIAADWGAVPRQRVMRRTYMDEAIHVANEMQMAVRRHTQGETLKLLELGARLRTWKMLEFHFPGRDWKSLQTDYERAAVKIFLAERKITCDTAEFALKVTRMRGLRR